MLPLSVGPALLFSAAIGLALAQHGTADPGLVAQIFGPRYMGTLFGIVFFSHQVGSFSASGSAATCTTSTAATT